MINESQAPYTVTEGNCLRGDAQQDIGIRRRGIAARQTQPAASDLTVHCPPMLPCHIQSEHSLVTWGDTYIVSEDEPQSAAL